MYQTPNYDPKFEVRFRSAMREISRNNIIDNAILKTRSNLGDDVSKIVYDVAREVMLDSKLNYVPVLTGRLRSSGRVGIPQYGGGKEVFSDMTYNTPYAWFVHEYHRSKSRYLERPFDDAIDSGMMEERIARRMLESWGLN